MIDILNKGLNTTPKDVIIKGNLRWWSYNEPITQDSQPIIFSNRDVSLKGWIEYALNNNIINIEGGKFFLVDTPAELPVTNENIPLDEGDRAIVLDIGTGQEGYYIYYNDQWNGPIILNAGSGGSGVLLEYSISNNSYVRSNATGITSSLSTGTLTVSIPDQREIYRLDIKGDNGASWVNSGVTTIALDYAWDNNRNEDLDSVRLPNVTVWDLTMSHLGGTISDTFPSNLVPSSGAPLVQLTSATSNDLTMKITGLNTYTRWGLSISF